MMLLLFTSLSFFIINPSYSFHSVGNRINNEGNKVLHKNRALQDFPLLNLADSSWNGEVVSNSPDGRMRGCNIQKVEDFLWTISIDGVEADLGKFSEAIYRKISSDAKKMRFQGFRPGTIPPHLIPTYIAYTMDECAREATLEAMAQNNIRAFEDARNDLKFEMISIPPITKKASTMKSKGKAVAANDGPIVHEEWATFNSMKEAIDSGWKVRDFDQYVYE